MDLEKVTARIRPRKGWEALDLGVTMVQNHAKVLYKLWFVISLPVFLLISLMLYQSLPLILLVFWWLKPILERPLLHFLSRELFGESLTVKDCVKAFYSVAKIHWFASLTWRRLSFTRSLDLPLIQLEGLKSSDRAKRLRVIHSGDSASAVWMTIVFAFVEYIFYFSTITLFFLFVPDIYSNDIDLSDWLQFESESNLTSFQINFLYYLAISAVAPFYVACGFALYLNQRTHLEAWDIELSFKRLAEKLKQRSANSIVRLANLAAVSLLMIASTSFIPNNVYAEEAPEEPVSLVEEVTHKKAKSVIEKIKKGEDFHQIERIEENRFINTGEAKENSSSTSSSDWSIWFMLARIFAVIVEFAVWLLIAVLLIFLVIRYKHLLIPNSPAKKTVSKRPSKLFGLDLTSESLPDQPWLVAKQLIEAEKYREGLSLLYRASLIWYIDHSEALIKEGYTELECLEQISQCVNQKSKTYIGRLTSYWRSLAYAHETPPTDKMLGLCDQWTSVMQLTQKTIGDRNAN
jgi:hypothetical protein